MEYVNLLRECKEGDTFVVDYKGNRYVYEIYDTIMCTRYDNAALIWIALGGEYIALKDKYASIFYGYTSRMGLRPVYKRGDYSGASRFLDWLIGKARERGADIRDLGPTKLIKLKKV